jgi:dGTPase
MASSYATPDTANDRNYSEEIRPGRSCFEIDRDRILHSTAFRRLDFKTQVFVPHVHDHFRTRMTHTLEVAQAGRNLARRIGLNEDLVEAAALAHDLGHPPFGHSGEHVLDELMSDHGRFEHNHQSLRIVDYLEHPFPGFRGLNLTNVLRECIAMHETRYDCSHSGEFDSGFKPPLEGQVCDAADEIAYTAADLEDGLVSGWITESQLRTLGLWQAAIARAEEDYPDARPIHRRIAAIRNVLHILIEDLTSRTLENIESMNISSPDDARNCSIKCVAFTEKMSQLLSDLQIFLMDNLYLRQDETDEHGKTEEILRTLFEKYVSCPELLPERYRTRAGEPGMNGKIEPLHRIACDYIAGMTDRFCREEFARLI